MFGSYLKSIRTTLGLTQEQASIRLNLLGGDLANIDCVTFSRWERGITQPSLSRRVRVLRAFENNLLPYLCSLGVDSSLKDDVEQFELSLKQRYQDAMSILSGIDYNTPFPIEHNHIDEEELSQSNEQDFIHSLNNFHNQLKWLNVKHNLTSIDLVEYQRDGRAIAYKYLSNKELVGHNIGMFFTEPTFENEIDRIKKNRLPIDSIDLRLTKGIKDKGVYSYYAISQHSKNERVFRKQLHTEFTFLAQNAQIHHYYASVTLKSSVDVMLKMGFSVAAYEGENPVGAIKVGSKRYTRAIMYIETSELFTQPEFLYLLTCCGVCSHRNCEACTERSGCIC
ncbi:MULTISPECIES: helix-turn-helix domain-containing protein [Vibrio]|uniref:helix-turn-helix domain-containing protein n=1 Tax=Vibrio TaxID=662 RepID=UPI000A2FEBBB|nr:MULTISPECIES: DNA-binding protein [Vibrio]ARR44758.1 DNA-binding protein [Vibrio campbellii]NDJ83350.1 DNA-binding protein [Vibrio sp. LB10LO1]CAD7810685.1 Helix-turn-helix XRE-family like proteins [Vibrio sp. B1FIG11]CAE6912752.1 Helix-turn-helix XRE-family like proteins [Vibrio sp. B1FIG11]